MADSTREDETVDEREEAEATGATPDEAHREGEFDALSQKLDRVLDGIGGLMTAIGALATAPTGDVAPAVGGSDDDDMSEYDRAKLVSLEDLDL